MSPDRIRPGSAGKRPERQPPEAAVAPGDVLPPTAAAPANGQAEEEAASPPAAATETTKGEGEIVRLEPPAPPVRRSAFRRLYHGESRFDFVRRKKTWFLFSAAVVLAGVISLAVQGLNLGIEFVGGTSWTVPSKTLTVQQVQNALSSQLSGETVTVLGNGAQRTVQIQARLPQSAQGSNPNSLESQISRTIAKTAGVNADVVSTESVGPSWGSQITHKAIEALIVFFILIAIYISVFFEWRMALAAIIAVVHDIFVVLGIYSLSRFLVTPDTVVAILTILGYSLYDTIVVFDRVRDNLKNLSVRDRMTVSDVVNLSMNQTLARSINTSLVAIMPILAVLVLGAQILGASTLQYFGLALLIGLTTGAYSSIFIASPLVALLKEHEPRYTQLRERLRVRGVDRVLLSASDIANGPVAELSNRRTGTDGTPNAASIGTERPRPPRGPSRPANRRPSSRNRPRGGRR